MRRSSYRVASCILLALAVALAARGDPASANTATTTFVVSTKLYSGCTLVTPNLYFAYSTGQKTPSTSDTLFTVTCPALSGGGTMPVTFTFTTSNGLFQMVLNKPPFSTLPYYLCNDSGCTQMYTESKPGPPVTLTGSPYTYTLWGQIPGGATIQRGTYAQQVTAVLTY